MKRSPRRARVVGVVLVGLAIVLAFVRVTSYPGSRAGTSDSAEVAMEPAPVMTATTMPVATRPAAALGSGFWPDELPAEITQEQVPARAAADLLQLFVNDIPPRDYFRTAVELGRLDPAGRLVDPTTPQIGERRTFYTSAGPREAELRLLTDSVYFWVETGVAMDAAALEAAATRLETDLLPELRRVFGREWQPGIDGDPRFSALHILSAPHVTELGYFVDENEYPRSVFAESNETEMIYLNMSRLSVGDELYLATLVHEIQHLIQWNMDSNEEVWLNEGLSQLSEVILGFSTVATRDHQQQPETRLDRWVRAPAVVGAHYATSYLFLQYLWEQLGEGAVGELARHPANGLAAARAILAGYAPERSLESFAADWAVANFLDDARAGSAFHYATLELEPAFFRSRLRRPPEAYVGALDQYAVDYIDLDLSGPVVVRFAGDAAVTLYDPLPGDAAAAWFAPPANSSHSQLTATVDLTGLGEATLAFDAWYDLEAGWDFAYVTASTDGGRSWDVLEPQHSAAAAFGPAFNGRSADMPGQSGGWVSERLSLSRYAGRVVLVRFDVVTDFDGPGRGFALANLAIPELVALGVPPVWSSAGFVEVGSRLPQQWAVRLIIEGESLAVVPFEVNERGQAELAVELGPEGAALMVMPLTPFTDAPADYWVSVESQ